MILAIKTDNPQAELYLLKPSGEEVNRIIWQADRQLAKDLLGKIEQLLKQNNTLFEDITGLCVYKGPGSFTGLRIGITVMNTIAYSEGVPIVGETGNKWLESGVKQLQNNASDGIVMPEYGAAARITKPKK